MSKVIRLTESDLTNLVKRVLLEVVEEDKVLNGVLSLACGTVNGVIQQGYHKGKKFCDVLETYNLTDEQIDTVGSRKNDKCPYVITKSINVPAGWNEIVKYYKAGTDGSELTDDVKQPLCADFYSISVKNSDGSEALLYTDYTGTYWRKQGGRGVQATWKWENNKPVFEGLGQVTRGATGYAQTEEEITSGKKILGLGSRGDLVKRVQFEILSDTNGKTNPGCKADQEGLYSPALCDGIYGNKTKNAVREFQRQERISSDGNVGAQTWQTMKPFPIDNEPMEIG